MRHDDALPRFTFFQRIVHWVVGLTFVALLATGLALSYPRLFWLTVLVGGGPTARWLHPWIGLLFAGGLFAMFVLWIRDMGLDRGDGEWLRAVKHYAAHERDKVPPAGKYNAGQKLFFWFQSGLGIGFLVTGIPLWLPSVLGTGVLPLMRLLHYLCALAGGLLLIVHVYLGTVAYPGTARGMLYGTVTRAWAKLHHPAWRSEEVER
jgi:formate dehydrogenase subunit gamma